MGHPLIDEFCRAHALRPEFFRRCQRVFKDEINPMLDEFERMKVEHAELKAKLEALQGKAQKRRVESEVVPA